MSTTVIPQHPDVTPAYVFLFRNPPQKDEEFTREETKKFAEEPDGDTETCVLGPLAKL